MEAIAATLMVAAGVADSVALEVMVPVDAQSARHYEEVADEL
jgi:hypothetical protein